MSCGSLIDQRKHASNASQLSYAARDGVAAFGRMAHLLDSGKGDVRIHAGRQSAHALNRISVSATPG